MGIRSWIASRLRRGSPADDLKRAGRDDSEPYIPLIPYPVAEAGERAEPGAEPSTPGAEVES